MDQINVKEEKLRIFNFALEISIIKKTSVKNVN